MIITIDGPAGSGKSTIARILAQRLGYRHLDTGMMYRTLTLKLLNARCDLDNLEQVSRLARSASLSFIFSTGTAQAFLDQQDVTEAIRHQEVTRAVSKVAAIPLVREIMVEQQRFQGRQGNIVADGRDMGTVVFPDADPKFFLDATPEERALRRQKELEQKGTRLAREVLLAEMSERDRKDSTREIGPLRRAADAVLVDTTGLDIEQVTALLLERIRAHTHETNQRQPALSPRPAAGKPPTGRDFHST